MLFNSLCSRAIASLTLLTIHTAAQSTLSSGALLVQTPQNLATCAPTTIQWYWSGSAFDASSHTLSIAVVPENGYSKRAIVGRKNEHARLIKRRSALQNRDAAIRIAGGSEVLMSDQAWLWNSVGVPPGRYRMALTVIGDGLTGYSSAFSVVTGSDTSCLGIFATTTTEVPDATATSTDAVSSTSQDVQTTTGESSSAIPTSSEAVISSVSATVTSAPVAANAQTSDAHHSNKGGKIAAAILVPIMAVFAVLAFFFFCRQRNSNEAQKRRQDWSEKATALLSRARSQGDGTNSSNNKASHLRNISEPLNAVHTAGMAQHDGNVRGELQEAREKQNAPVARVTSIAGTEHWVDFTGETDACPITPERLEAIARASTDQARSTEHDLHQDAASHDLQQQSDRQSSGEVDSRVISNTSAASTLPPYLREVRSPAASFGQDCDGRPLGQRADSGKMTQVHRNPSNASTVTVSSETRAGNVARDLVRTVSNRSVRRKPVPHVSVSSVNDGTAVSQHDPFADNAEDSSEGHPDSAPVILPQHHMSMQSGRTIGDDQLQEMLLSDGLSSSASRTPHHSISIDAPHSVVGSPTARQIDVAGLTSLVPGRSLTGPVDVGMSEAGSPYPDAAHRDAWKLSVGLSEPERGFRVSFPVEQDVLADEDEQHEQR